MTLHHRRAVLTGLGAAAIGALATTPALSQAAYPTQAIKFIVPAGAGGLPDTVARIMGRRLQEKVGQSVVIENKPGGDSIVGIAAFVGAKDDHILLMSPTSAFTAHPFLHDNLPYKPEDLAPIARVSNTFIGITVPIASPANSLDEFAALLRAKPAELSRRDRRQRVYVRGLAQCQQARHEEGAVPQRR